ncbi:MAG: hypothetical protein Ct9H90mP1_1920 [Methanobacteriota archaeon]|nr:MAG: hypothetical protein Ct9H90mP1_1920 [Euryarchaeota archaeon]
MTQNDTIKGEQGTFILKRVPVNADMETQQNSFPITVVRAQTDDIYTLSPSRRPVPMRKQRRPEFQADEIPGWT